MKNSPVVGIVMGSDSDWPVMKFTAEQLEHFGVAYEKKVVSAHRTPDLMFEYADRRISVASSASSPAPAAPLICPA